MDKLKLVVPKGRIMENVIQLMNEIGINLKGGARSYRPVVDDIEMEIKIMKPQNIPGLIEFGSHDAGFTGLDWIDETDAKVERIMDLGFDPVRIVVAAHSETLKKGLFDRKIIVASEYESIARKYLDKKKYNYRFLRTFGATEVFPPDDADMIIDNTSTGQTLKEHGLEIIDTVMTSSTWFITNRETLDNPWKKQLLVDLEMLFRSILDARKRVILEMNVPKDKLQEVVDLLPCMRSPTVSPLYGEEGFAVKTAVFRKEVRILIPQLKKMGATDILEYHLGKVVV